MVTGLNISMKNVNKVTGYEVDRSKKYMWCKKEKSEQIIYVDFKSFFQKLINVILST